MGKQFNIDFIKALQETVTKFAAAGVMVHDVGVWADLVVQQRAANIQANDVYDKFVKSQKLEKGQILFRDGLNTRELALIEFQYNPAQFSKDVGIVFNSEVVPGGISSNISYIGCAGAKVNFDLFFYTGLKDQAENWRQNMGRYMFNTSKDFATENEDLIEVLGLVATYMTLIESYIIPTRQFEPPPYVQVRFGPAISYKGYIEGYRTEYLQFDKSLKPTMGRISLSLLCAEVRKAKLVSDKPANTSNADKQKNCVGPEIISVSAWKSIMWGDLKKAPYNVKTWNDLYYAVHEGETKIVRMREVADHNGFDDNRLYGELEPQIIAKVKKNIAVSEQTTLRRCDPNVFIMGVPAMGKFRGVVEGVPSNVSVTNTARGAQINASGTSGSLISVE